MLESRRRREELLKEVPTYDVIIEQLGDIVGGGYNRGFIRGVGDVIVNKKFSRGFFDRKIPLLATF